MQNYGDCLLPDIYYKLTEYPLESNLSYVMKINTNLILKVSSRNTEDFTSFNDLSSMNSTQSNDDVINITIYSNKESSYKLMSYSFSSTQRMITLGKDNECDIIIKGIPFIDCISNVHCTFKFDILA
jgi:hypothetical protein